MQRLRGPGPGPADSTTATVPHDEEAQERLAERIAAQWAEARAARRAEPEALRGGPSNFSRAQVPWAFDLAAAWSWRLIVIAAAAWVLIWLIAEFAVIVIPLIVALLITALVVPLVQVLQRLRVPRALASLLVVVLTLGSISLLLTFVGQQVASGLDDLNQQVVQGIDQVREWLKTGPLQLSDADLQQGFKTVQDELAGLSGASVVDYATKFGTTLGHVFAGFFIILFATYFFLADGSLIWTWVVRLFPRAARLRADSSGQVAWRSLTSFVRATVMVAAVDAIGIAFGAWILGVPFPLAIGVLVFLGAFVPMIGATLSGLVAVLVALVAQGPFTALLMFGVVILVQQIEGHVLQPFLMGRFVRLHPLGVIVAIGCGVLIAGIAGALLAVPLAAAGNAVAQHLASFTEVGDDPEEACEEEAPDLPPAPA